MMWVDTGWACGAYTEGDPEMTAPIFRKWTTWGAMRKKAKSYVEITAVARPKR